MRSTQKSAIFTLYYVAESLDSYEKLAIFANSL